MQLDQSCFTVSPEPTRRQADSPPQLVGNLDRRMPFANKSPMLNEAGCNDSTAHTYVVNGDSQDANQACEKCCEAYYEWQDLQLPSETPGVHDGHFTTGEVFLKMLKDERGMSMDLIRMAYG